MQYLKVASILFFITGIMLVIMSAYNIVSFHRSNVYSLPNNELPENNVYASENELPDIFYIIVDGYGRQDILNELYDFDNSEFIDSLEQRGFYVAQKSMSNYCQTTLSLASSLNLDYINNLVQDLDEDSLNRHPVIDLIKNNRVMNKFEKMGYYRTSFFTPYSPVNIKEVENYQRRTFPLNEFSHFIINKTMLPLFLRDVQYDFYRKDILHIINNLSGSMHNSKPNFVYAHIIPPHPPFVFDGEGEPLSVNRNFSFADGSHWPGEREAYINSYIKHVKFINSQILEVIDDILTQSARPIIIIQSDHGPGSGLDWADPLKTDFTERLSILNAYYFFDSDYEQLHHEITPVNTFRVIFNQFFNADFELLKDESYFSTWRYPYKFIEVKDS